MSGSLGRLFFFVSLICCFNTPVKAETQIIRIQNQQDFDSMGSMIRMAVSQKDIDVVRVEMQKGTYLYHDDHLNLSALKYPEKSIVVNGNDAILIADSTTNVKEGMEPYNVCYLDGNLKGMPTWSNLIQLGSNIEVLDVKSKYCRARIPSGIKVDQSSQYIKVSEWYKVGIYKVEQIKNGYVYFIADDLIPSNYGYNVNWDNGYGHKYPRIQVLHPVTNGCKYVCRAGQFLSMGGTTLSQLEFCNLNFNGSSGSHILFMFSHIQADCIAIKNCSFHNCLGILSYLVKTSNFCFQNNWVDNCENICVKSEGGCSNTCVSNNTFKNVCATLNNKAAVSCSGDKFLIKGNQFINFSYAAVVCGLHYSMHKSEKISGEIEENEFFHDAMYRSVIASNGLMDGGAIYVLTQTDGITIRNNYIHDISGVKDNRGIFCDDGAKNVTITGNVIQRIQNSYCIDLRNVTSVAKKVPDHNTGNTCADNLVDGDIRFYLRDESCRESNNKKIGDRGYKTMKAYKNWEGKIK